jgi:hypothetical protein
MAMESPVTTAVDKANTTAQLTLRVIRTLEEIEDLRAIWSDWNQHRHSDIDFYLGHESSAPGFVRPHIILLSREGNPEAMLIGRLVHERVEEFYVGRRRVWRPKVRVLHISEGGLLGNLAAPHCELFVREIMAALDRDEADMATFHRLWVDTPTFRFATRLPKYLNRDPFVDTRLHSSMRLTRSYDDSLRCLSAHHRKQLQRGVKKLLANHPSAVDVRSFREAGELEKMVRDVVEIARKTWQRARGGGFIDTERMRQSLELAARMGWLRTDVLYIDGKPCAYSMGSLYRGTFYSDLVGYDPEYSRYSPGTYLFSRIIEDLCRQDVKTLDLGIGEDLYKKRFVNCNWQDADVYMFAGSFLGMGLRTLRLMTRMTAAAGKWGLGVTGMMPRLRRAWRNHHPQDSSFSA